MINHPAMNFYKPTDDLYSHTSGQSPIRNSHILLAYQKSTSSPPHTNIATYEDPPIGSVQFLHISSTILRELDSQTQVFISLKQLGQYQLKMVLGRVFAPLASIRFSLPEICCLLHHPPLPLQYVLHFIWPQC